MLGKLFKVSDKPQEVQMIFSMLAVGFFIGVFNATYQVVADTIFLKRLPQQLNSAFLVAGVLGILATTIFSWLQNLIKFSILVAVSLITIVAFTASVYWAYHFGPEQYHDAAAYIMYATTGPITAILLMSYWGTFGRLFDFRQSKRIISWIDSGQLIAAIIALFLIPLTSAIFGDISNYLIVSAVSIAFAALIMIITSSRFTLTRNSPSEFGNEFKNQTRVASVLKDPYGGVLSAMVVISMLCFVLTQFSFQQLSNAQYPSERDLGNFLAYFNGSIYLICMVMQAFVNDRILSNYGLRITLFVLPAAILIFSVASLLSGIFIGTTPEANPTLFVFFFIFVALTRWFNWMLRDSLETPIFKLFFIPIDSRFRFGVQSKVEGVINESGRLLAGAIIFGLSLIAFFNVIWISVLIMLAAGIYFVIVNNLYNGYRGKIREKLENKGEEQEKLEFGLTAIMKRLEEFLFGANAARSIFSFKLLERINPVHVSVWVNTLMKHQTEEVQEFAQYRMNEIKGLTVSERYVIFSQNLLEGKIKLTKQQIELLLKSGGEITRTRLQQLVRSPHAEDRIYASELLLHSSSEEHLSFLIELLSDNTVKVRITAIKTASKRFNNEVIFNLIDLLSNKIYANQATESIVIIGAKALSNLESSFYRSGQMNSTLLKIVQIMGRIGGNKARELLWNKIDYPDKVVVNNVLLALGESGFKAGVSQITRVKYAIESDIADISWNLNAIKEAGEEEEVEELRKALRVEIQNDIEHVYKLLAMLYDTHSIQLVKENIESGTAEGTTYAIELLDIFLSEQLKQRIIPVLDDLSDEERISRLEVLYPRYKLDSKLVLKFLINRDFAQSNRWTKACALHRIGTLRLRDFSMDLIAQLFNPDSLIREVSAWALYQINPDLYHENVKRLGSDKSSIMDKVILSSDGSQLMEFEKIKFYQTLDVLSGIPGITLSYLSDISEELRLKTNDVLRLDQSFNEYFYLLYRGSVDHYSKGRLAKSFSRGDFVGEMLASTHHLNSNLLQAKEDAILLKLEKSAVYELLSDKIMLTEKFLAII